MKLVEKETGESMDMLQLSARQLNREPVESIDASLSEANFTPNIAPDLAARRTNLDGTPAGVNKPAYTETYFTLNQPTGPGPYISNVLDIEPSMKDWFHEQFPCHPFYVQFRMYQGKVLSCSARHYLSTHLNPEVNMGLSEAGFQKDWRGLAQAMGKDHQFTHNLARFKDPTGELLLTWQTENGSTIAKLITNLTKIDRYDILDDIRFMDFIKNSCKDYDLQRETELRREQAERKRLERPNLTVGDVEDEQKEQFDAFVCFSDEDYEFMHEMIRELEDDAGFKLCLDVRDILEHDNHTITAEVIKERCKRTIVILSQNFVREDNKLCEFAMRVAQSLSPAASRSKIIPILIDKHCTVPTSLRHLTLVNATRLFQKEFMWPKIKATLHDCMSQIYLVEQEKLRHVLLEADSEGANLRDIIMERHEQHEARQKASEEAKMAAASAISPSSSTSSKDMVRIRVVPTQPSEGNDSPSKGKGKKLSKRIKDGIRQFHWKKS